MLKRLASIGRHLRQGTLADAVRSRLRRMPLHARVHWYGADSVDQAARALSDHASLVCTSRPGGIAASVGDGGKLHARLNQRLRGSGLRFRSISGEQLIGLAPAEIAELRCIVCGHERSADIARTAAALLDHPQLAQVPFEYAAGLDPERATFARLDEYRHTFFVSPLLRDPVPVYSIYEESLQRFEQKCGLRDYLDLYQLLRHVHRSGVPGDIAEFGSYRGHSGWLAARLLKALGSDKKLYMFDAFEKFPRETYGVDEFWSGTHDVDFEQVRASFHDVDNVVLVKGDFTRTLETHGPAQLALAYVDCDSYRATRYLVEAIWEPRLSRNGVMAFEDYGHLALLGNRLAVDACVREPGFGFQFFSQFSGLYVALKTQ
ncbi:MAG TPA: TylF/MycF/NovP-related O-methyltransferase [Solimonas sp.]|nr:TylF/MycF/NovP-related O-methyltransferase [Solimonas sp.]